MSNTTSNMNCKSQPPLHFFQISTLAIIYLYTVIIVRVTTGTCTEAIRLRYLLARIDNKDNNTFSDVYIYYFTVIYLIHKHTLSHSDNQIEFSTFYVVEIYFLTDFCNYN